MIFQFYITFEIDYARIDLHNFFPQVLIDLVTFCYLVTDQFS